MAWFLIPGSPSSCMYKPLKWACVSCHVNCDDSQHSMCKSWYCRSSCCCITCCHPLISFKTTWAGHFRLLFAVFFPESVWAKGSSNSEVCHHILSSHLLIFTSSYIFSFSYIFSSLHLLIFIPSHLHTFSSSYLLIFTPSHLHTFSSSHLLIFTSSHLLSLALLPSCPLAFFSLLLFYFSLKARGSANEAPRNATLSHEMRFIRQKLSKIAILKCFV